MRAQANTIALLSVLLLAWGCASSPAPSPATPSDQAPAIPAIPNAKQPLPGVVTGGAPSDEDLRAAKAAGYKTVVSLLPEAQSQAEAALVQELGLRFVSIPIAGAEDLTEDNARRLGEVLEAGDTKPLILHCGSGNRAGALLALEAFYVQGADAAQALELGDRAGLTRLRPAVEQRLQAASEGPAPAP